MSGSPFSKEQTECIHAIIDEREERQGICTTDFEHLQITQANNRWVNQQREKSEKRRAWLGNSATEIFTNAAGNAAWALALAVVVYGLAHVNFTGIFK